MATALSELATFLEDLMDLRFPVKEPNKAYISNSLWLPKGMVQERILKKALEFTVTGSDMVDGAQRYTQKTLKLWQDSKNHLICPREFINPAKYPLYRFPFIDARPEFEKVEFRDNVIPRNEEQENAWQALALNNNGILNLACGKGKTILANKKIAQRGTPTLVIVPDGGILSQWRETILGNANGRRPAIEFDGGLGLIQGQEFDWRHPVTLALVTTLWQKIEQGIVPEEMYRYFGQIIYDEVHQIGAPKFSLTASPFYGDRIGLTATVNREDGLDPIYLYHIGEPFYSDLQQDLIPRIYFQQTPASIDVSTVQINKMTNIGLLRTALGMDYKGNVFRYWSIREALREDRKILCISHSVYQLKLFHEMFPGSGLIIGETNQNDRMDILRNHQVTFAVSRLGSTGVDDDRLDTLFWLTPFRSKIALQQSMGRIQRPKEGKKTPVMVVFEDWQTSQLRRLCLNLRVNLREWGYEFETLKPSNLPLALPVGVDNVYRDLHRTLEDEQRVRALERRGGGVEEDID